MSAPVRLTPTGRVSRSKAHGSATREDKLAYLLAKRAAKESAR